MHSFPKLSVNSSCQIALCLLLLPFLTLAAKESISCYACGHGEYARDCTNFNYTEVNSTKECSSDAQGCSIYYEGESITNMGCENYKFNVCHKANSVTYCYCNKSLCNGSNLLKNVGMSSNSGYSSDDEDLAEGSGFQSKLTDLLSTRLAISTTVPSATKPPNTGIYLRNNIGIFVICGIIVSVY